MLGERRYSARHPVALDVQLIYGKRRFYRARASDLSSHGMQLRLHNLTLPTGTLVELELGCLGRDWLIEAVVVHRSDSGVGVMFREPQPELYQGLLQGLIGVSRPGAEAETPRQTAGNPRPRLARG